MGNPFSSFTEELEDFVRPVTDPIRSGLAKITPKEIKPYLTTALSLGLGAPAGAMGGGFQGFLGRMIGGGLQDAFIQKLFTDPDDEDTDVDLLRAGTTGFFRGLQGIQPQARLVDIEKSGVALDPQTNTYQAVTKGDKSAINMASRLNLGVTDPTAAGAALDANFYGADPSALNYFQSDFSQGLKNFATPTNPFDEGSFMGGLGEVSSQLGAIQAVNTPSQVRDAKKALEAAEREYQNYLDTLEADQRASIEADMNERIAAYKQYMGLAGFTNAEIDDALVNAGYLASGETVYAAQGGRIGFANGTDSMGIGNYIEAENVRTEFMDKIQRMLQAEEMNMKLNDPGLMRFINAFPGGEGFYTRQEVDFPDMKARYEQMIEQMKMDQAKDDYEKDQIKKQLRKDEFDDIVNMIDDRFSDNRQQRKMASVGGRMTSEGDPISPDVPEGMQMDLRPGGFIPLGTKPKADDVPAMVGKNEFVLNDEAVSGIGKLLTGKPDPRAGARALYDLQSKMEAIV